MIVKGSSAITPAIRGEFIKAFLQGVSYVERLCLMVGSDKPSESYAWLGEVAAIKEWLGEREIKGFTDASYSITNKLWEGTLGVKRTEIEDDQTDGIMTRVRDLAGRAREHYDDLMWQVLVAGGTAGNNGYDGVSFFNAAHPARTPEGTAFANTLTGTGVTVAALKSDIQAAKAAMLKIKDERGKPFWKKWVPGDIVAVIPPDIEQPFKEALNAALISNTSNLLQGQIGEVVVCPFLTDVNDWFLLNLGGAVKPLIFQERVPLTFEEQTQNSEAAFMRDVFVYGTRARYNVGYGMPQAAIRTTN